MIYLKSKIGHSRKYFDEFEGKPVVVDGVRSALTHAAITDSSELVVGQAYTCTITPSAGYYLPPVISVEGTASTYGFMYDHTTGRVYIPSDEVIGDILISGEASDVNWNVPAQFEAHKVTIDTYNDLDPETFLLLTVTPSRGSTVQVTYGDVTKTVTGSLTTDKYNSSPIEVFFGTYFGVSDEVETPDSGVLTISGAYESFDLAAKVWTDEGSKGADSYETAYILDNIINIGTPRYLVSHSMWTPYSKEDIDIVFNTPIGISNEGDASGIFGCNGVVTYNKKPYYYAFDVAPVNPDKAELYESSVVVYAKDTNPADVTTEDNFWYDNGRINTAYYNVDFGEWLEKSRMGLIQDTDGKRLNVYVNGEDVYNIETLIVPNSCKTLTYGSFDGFDNIHTIEISEHTGIDYSEALLINSYLDVMKEELLAQIYESYPDITEEEAMLMLDEYMADTLMDLIMASTEMDNSFFPSSCENVIISPDNTRLYSENTCIIAKDESRAVIVGANAGIIPDGVKEILAQAFSSTASESVRLPDTLTTIHALAFNNCIYKCPLNIPNSVNYIGFAAFLNLTNLTEAESEEDFIGITGELNIPNSVQYIGDFAFMGNVLLSGNLNIPYGIEQINFGAFAYSGMGGLNTVTIPESVTTILGMAFMLCGLSNVNLPDSITFIGSSAFARCVNLLNINLPSSLRIIGTSAFQDAGLTHIEIPASVVYIGDLAFNTVTSVTMLATTPPSIAAETFTSGTLTSITVPSGTGDTYKADANWSAFADIIVEAT